MNNYYVIFISITVAIFANLYISQCFQCVKPQIIFSDLNAKECLNNCKYCWDNRFTNWFTWIMYDDYSFKN